jgi:hypothetical protein
MGREETLCGMSEVVAILGRGMTRECRVYARVYALDLSGLPLTAMLNLVRAFVGAPASTFHCLSLPTESLLVSLVFLLSVFTRTISFFLALPICRHSGHPRCYLPPPRSYASLFSSLSWPRPRERAYHVPRRRFRVEARMYILPYHKAMCFPLIPGRWSQHPARGLPFGPSLGSLLALGSFTHHSTFLMTSTLQLLTVDPVRFPCCCVFFAIAHPVQVSWPSRHNQRYPFTL